MRAVVQRVHRASVTVGGERVAGIGPGLLIFLGVKRGDGEEQARWLAEKIAHLRIFEDTGGRMNRSLLDVGGEALIVSQFTLYGDARKGRRPSFDQAADPEAARVLYERFIAHLTTLGVPTSCGVFQARMLVSLENDGPVTLILESP